MPYIVFSIALSLSTNTYANSLAPVLPVLSMWGWLGMPVIIFVEFLYFRQRGFGRPLALSAYGNMFSGLVGIAPALATGPLMLGPAIEPTSRDVLLLAFIATSVGIIFNWWLSAQVEMFFVKRAKWWKEESLTIKHFYQANVLTYSIIAVVLYLTQAIYLYGTFKQT